MQFCGGDPFLFGFFSIGILFFIIGGGLWGSGNHEKDRVKEIVGIVITVLAAISTTVGILIFTWKSYKKMAEKKQMKSDLNKFQSEYAKTEERRTSSVRISSNSGKDNGWVNPAHKFIPEKANSEILSKNRLSSSRSSGKISNDIEMTFCSAVPNKSIPMPGKADSPSERKDDMERSQKPATIQESIGRMENIYGCKYDESMYSEGETMPDCIDGSKCDFPTSNHDMKKITIKPSSLSYEDVDLETSHSSKYEEVKDKKVRADIKKSGDVFIVRL